MATEQFVGPIDYVVFAFDAHADLSNGLLALLERVNQGVIEILDIELIGQDSSGAPKKLAFTDLDGVTGIDLAVFDGLESGILDSEDLVNIAAELETGQIALTVELTLNN